MDMGGLVEFLMLLLLAGVVAALALNFVAAFLGARSNAECRAKATLTGFILGTAVTVAAAWLLLLYREAWAWSAFVLGPGVAFGVAPLRALGGSRKRFPPMPCSALFAF